MAKTIFGFQVRVVGEAPHAARYGGFSRNRTIWLSLLVGGGLAGLAGIFEAAGPFGQMVPQFPTGYGFTAIIVAFLGRLHPIGIVILGGLVLAVTYVGGETAQATLGLPSVGHRRLPGDAALLPARHRHPRHLPAAPARPDGSRVMSSAVCISIFMTIVGAATPLLLAALGELVVEKTRRAEPRRRGHDADRRGHRLRGDLA